MKKTIYVIEVETKDADQVNDPTIAKDLCKFVDGQTWIGDTVTVKVYHGEISIAALKQTVKNDPRK